MNSHKLKLLQNFFGLYFVQIVWHTEYDFYLFDIFTVYVYWSNFKLIFLSLLSFFWMFAPSCFCWASLGSKCYWSVLPMTFLVGFVGSTIRRRMGWSSSWNWQIVIWKHPFCKKCRIIATRCKGYFIVGHSWCRRFTSFSEILSNDGVKICEFCKYQCPNLFYPFSTMSCEVSVWVCAW